MTTSRHRQARTLLFAAACASVVACNSADIANYNSPNTSQLEGSPNAATVNTTVAGVFTKSKCPGAPVEWCQAAMKGGKARLVVVNAGNANVFTGKAGRETCAATAAAMAAAKVSTMSLPIALLGRTKPREGKPAPFVARRLLRRGDSIPLEA